MGMVASLRRGLETIFPIFLLLIPSGIIERPLGNGFPAGVFC